MLGSSTLLTGLTALGLGFWISFEHGMGWGALLVLGVGIGFTLSGAGAVWGLLRAKTKIAGSAYALSSKCLFSEFEGQRSQIFAVTTPAVVHIARHKRGRFSDFEVTLLANPRDPAKVTLIYGVLDGGRVESLLKQVLIGPGENS